MFLRDYEQRLEPQLSAELGEPILRCIGEDGMLARSRHPMSLVSQVAS
jgi:hypothetical protein